MEINLSQIGTGFGMAIISGTRPIERDEDAEVAF